MNASMVLVGRIIAGCALAYAIFFLLVTAPPMVFAREGNFPLTVLESRFACASVGAAITLA